VHKRLQDRSACEDRDPSRSQRASNDSGLVGRPKSCAHSLDSGEDHTSSARRPSRAFVTAGSYDNGGNFKLVERIVAAARSYL